jgi:hypothetical protein
LILLLLADCSLSEAKALAQLLPADYRFPRDWITLTGSRLPGQLSLQGTAAGFSVL